MDDTIKTELSKTRIEIKPPLKLEEFLIYNTEPVEITLEPGPLAFCGCGKSSVFPFCDGTQNGKRFRQVSYKIAEKRSAWLCKNHRISNWSCEPMVNLEV